MKLAIQSRTRLRRNARLAALGTRVGLGHASTAARKIFAGAKRREELSRARELQTAEQIADELGNMKGALMKLGQMASYLDEGLPEPFRLALAQLQTNAPPMAHELVEAVILQDLGAPISDTNQGDMCDRPFAAVAAIVWGTSATSQYDSTVSTMSV